METEEGFNGDLLPAGGFAQLLESGQVGLAISESYIYPSPFSHDDPSKMLRFGDRCSEPEVGFLEKESILKKKPVINGCDSSSTSSSGGSSFSKSRVTEVSTPKTRHAVAVEGKAEDKRRSGSRPDPFPRSDTVTDNNGKTCKKAKTEATPSKGKKEKLGERITALQKLVSPFGKTDTASVLHEAMGYIRFLHDQVQVLTLPYMQRLLSTADHQPEGEREQSRYDLRSRGLCLVPISCTSHVANCNGADFWSPATGSNISKH